VSRRASFSDPTGEEAVSYLMRPRRRPAHRPRQSRLQAEAKSSGDRYRRLSLAATRSDWDPEVAEAAS
jgi:hypothetical protein